MGIALAGILKAAASSILGDKLKRVVVEKVTTVARDKLGLPPEASSTEIDAALAENPEVAAQMQQIAADIRIEQEQTYQIAIQEQGASERVALQSESAFVRNARPTMIYLGGFSCFGIICFGVAIAWFRPAALADYVQLISATAMPLTALLTAGGVYAYRRTTDKAIQSGISLPSLLNIGE